MRVRVGKDASDEDACRGPPTSQSDEMSVLFLCSGGIEVRVGGSLEVCVAGRVVLRELGQVLGFTHGG